jgi:hypothetical protein
MKELIFQSQVIKNLKSVHKNIWILNTCVKHTIGIPDLLIGLDGQFIGMELKVGHKEKHSIQSLFPKSRKQIPTMYDIEKAGNKAFGLILFDNVTSIASDDMVMLFRIDCKRFELNNDFLIHLNKLIISPYNTTYNEFNECIIEPICKLSDILECIK